MKKTWQLLCILVLFILFGCFLFSDRNRNVQLHTDENHSLVLSLKANDGNRILYPWFDESSGITYFFLPSFVQDNRIYCDYLKDELLTIDGDFLSKRTGFTWEPETSYSIECDGQEYDVVFMKSANLPSLFLETESGSMEAVNADKEYEEPGSVSLVNTTGNAEYQGKLKRISARGNSTFATDKKAYTFTLDKASPLCGLEAGKKWNLLALYYEYDKIHTKLIYEMADYLGLEYTPGCTWVDLYCNGEYQGLYLLTEAVTVADGRVEIHDLDKENEKSENPANISGGYLIEREETERLEPAEAYFTTTLCGYNFALKSPKTPTDEELDYISSYIQNIENMLVEGDTGYKDYLDLDSFAKQFLIDKIVLNPDAMRMSAFYYKDRNSDILKAGPLWDYDRAMGTSLPDYTASLEAFPDSMNGWYMPLYGDEEFYDKLLSYYEQLLPFLEDMLENKIDAYSQMLHDSIAMDTTRRPLATVQCDSMSYMEQESYIKYLKYFLANRLNYLNETWNIPYSDFALPSSTGDMHTIRFFAEDGTLLETRSVTDGECMTDLPALDAENYSGWQFYQTGKLYHTMNPIYEDMDFYAKQKFNSPEEYMAYKLNQIKAEASLENYLKLLQDTDLSICIYFPVGSELLRDEDMLTALEAVSACQTPEKLRAAADSGKDYFLLVDNGWQSIWESLDGEALGELSTTFGAVNYETSEDGKRHLYIQGGEADYLALGEDNTENKTAVQFVVVNRLTGSIEDVAAFTVSERKNRE